MDGASIVEAFRQPLEELERERSKVRRDHRGFLFIACLAFTMAFACLGSALLGDSRFLFILAAVLSAGGVVALRFRTRVDSAYQALFRDKVTRQWFHQRFLGVFLAAPPKEFSPEALYLLGEAGLLKARLEDRIYFDRETEDSHVYAVSKGTKRFLYFMKKRQGAVSAVENHFPFTLSKFGKVKTRANSEGIWIALELKHRLFAAPVFQETTDPSGYSTWNDDAKILLDPDVRLHWIAAR